MKYINNSSSFNYEFKRLMNAYDNYHWMVAWAGSSFNMTKELLENSEKIKRIVVGLHFYQTHPDFIDHFNSFPQVSFIHSTSGTFHPKVYLFSNDEENWELLIGSPNFTNAAFNQNNEACVLISSVDSNNVFYKQIRDSIDSVWKDSKKFTDVEREDYRRFWMTQRVKVESLKRYKEEQSKRIPFYQIPVVRMNWREYIERIFAANSDTVEERIRVLNFAQDYFNTYPVFAGMPILERSRIGGYKWVNQPADFRLFGTMQNAATYKNQINTNPINISNALDAIPLRGEVTREDYFLFVEQFELALNGGNKYRSATRLLSMKRPDVFFGISSANHERLAEDFEISGITTMNLERYWDEIVVRTQESSWWNEPKPANEIEESIANYRAAFMDAMYYDPTVNA